MIQPKLHRYRLFIVATPPLFHSSHEINTCTSPITRTTSRRRLTSGFEYDDIHIAPACHTCRRSLVDGYILSNRNVYPQLRGGSAGRCYFHSTHELSELTRPSLASPCVQTIRGHTSAFGQMVAVLFETISLPLA
jgi:hypothetical protein